MLQRFEDFFLLLGLILTTAAMAQFDIVGSTEIEVNLLTYCVEILTK